MESKKNVQFKYNFDIFRLRFLVLQGAIEHLLIFLYFIFQSVSQRVEEELERDSDERIFSGINIPLASETLNLCIVCDKT
jgi:hypothetical protein